MIRRSVAYLLCDSRLLNGYISIAARPVMTKLLLLEEHLFIKLHNSIYVTNIHDNYRIFLSFYSTVTLAEMKSACMQQAFIVIIL